MSQATSVQPIDFSLATPLLLKELAKEFSLELQSVVERICNSILEDLGGLCELFKKGDQSSINQYWSEELGETYVGFGIGYRFGLGFLEDVVVTALKTRFLKMGASVTKIRESGGRTGGYSRSGELYATSEGTYAVIHTHSWFIKRRVEK